MKRFTLVFTGMMGLLAISKLPVYAGGPIQANIGPSVVTVSSVSLNGNSQAQITLSTPTAGQYSTGNFNYITNIYVVAYATGTTVAQATPATCTTTNLQSLKLTFPTVLTAGTATSLNLPFTQPLASSGTGYTQITCPATGGVLWNMVVSYFTGA